MPMIYAQAIIPELNLSDKKLRGTILGTMKKYERLIENAMREPTATWSTGIAIESELSYAEGDIAVIVTTDDKRYLWLDNGTDIRYATMSNNFVSKTVVGSLSSRPGRGGVRYVNRKHPRPGITARGWTYIIYDTVVFEFQVEIRRKLQNLGIYFE